MYLIHSLILLRKLRYYIELKSSNKRKLQPFEVSLPLNRYIGVFSPVNTDIVTLGGMFLMVILIICRASAVFVGVYEPTKQKLLKSFPDNLSALAHLVSILTESN